MATLTSANSSLVLAIANLYPSPQLIQGYTADDAFMAESLDMAEVVMGVDGIMSSAFIFNPVKMTITLQATSPSIDIFDAWSNFQRGSRELYQANGSIVLPAIGKKYTLTNGVLTSSKLFPDVKKTLQPVAYSLTWESVIAENF